MVLSPYRFNRRAVALAKARVRQELELHQVLNQILDLLRTKAYWRANRPNQLAGAKFPNRVSGKSGSCYSVSYYRGFCDTTVEVVVKAADGRTLTGEVDLC